MCAFNFVKLTACLTAQPAGAVAAEGRAVHAFTAACHALGAIVWHPFPLHEKPILHAGDVIVPISIGSPENRHDSEEAALWDAAQDALAREIPAVAEPDEGTLVARQAVKPSRSRRW